MNTGVAFIYCTSDDSSHVTNYIRVAISQLCHRVQHLPPSLQELYEKHSANSQPTYQELMSTFLETIQQFQRIFFVLDALDECAQPHKKDLCQFLRDITEATATSKPTHVKVLVMSRMDLDIKQVLKASLTIRIQAAMVDNDIEIYVKDRVAQLSQDDLPAFRNLALKNKILSELNVKPCGM